MNVYVVTYYESVHGEPDRQQMIGVYLDIEKAIEFVEEEYEYAIHSRDENEVYFLGEYDKYRTTQVCIERNELH